MIFKKLIFLLLLFVTTISTFYASVQTFENITLSGKQKDIEIIQTVLWQFDADIRNFQRSVGSYLDSKINIKIAADKEEYNTWTKGSGKVIEFSQAFYNRKTNTIFLRHPSELKSLTALKRILLHEYIHHFVGKFWRNPPLWFNEGMAVYFTGDLGFEREMNFARNYVLGNSRSLEMMKYHYPRNQIEWESFYAKSGLAVKYLYQKKQEFYRLWDNSIPDGEFENAFRKSFLMTTRDFSIIFEEYARTHFRAELLLASTGMIWSILPLVLIAGVIRKKIKNRKQLKVWKGEEELIDPDSVILSVVEGKESNK